jgi:hypothetical protein
MKFSLRIFTIFYFILFQFQVQAARSDWKTFYDLYGESMYLDSAKTWAQSLKGRWGYRNEHPLPTELYLTSRLGADSRTLLESGSSVYNDNYFFLGPGVDLLSLLPGLRITLSTGYSWDLTDKIDRSGFDFQTGTLTYHEIPLAHRLVDEIYSELLYVHRYENLFFNIQNRLRYLLFEKGQFRIYPLVNVNLSLSYDAQKLPGARYADIRPGARIQVPISSKVGINIEPQYVYRFPLQAPRKRIDQFRILLWLYVGF